MAVQKWNRVKALKNPMAIKEIQDKYEIFISKELAECILFNNAGRPKPNTIIMKNGEENDVKMLLSYNEDDVENIYKVIDYFIKTYNGSLIPFATDSSGNYYCEQERRIVLWTQNKEIFPICNSFEQFIESFCGIE